MQQIIIGALLLLILLILVVLPGAGKVVVRAIMYWIAVTMLGFVAGFLVLQLLNVSTWSARSALASFIAENKFFSPEEMIASGIRYDDVLRRDTDGDKELERILTFRYDITSGRSPLGATILDLNNCRPRTLDSYDLFPMDRDYLSESRYNLEMRDIANVGGKSDLLFWGQSADGIRTELAIFQWYNLNEACKVADPHLRGYALLGNFRGTGGVNVQDDGSVRVLDRAFERSQLAVVSVYRPQNGAYRPLPDGPMYPPAAKAIEFTFGAPDPTTQTFYPEKTAVAFYMTIGLDTPKAQALLDPAVVSTYIQGKLGVDVAEPGQTTSMAEVKEVAYRPDSEKERSHGEMAVEVEVLNRRQDGSLAPQTHRYRVWVRGFPNPKAAPYGCEWRIFRFEALS
jgi:hypothetical protein